MSPGHVNSLASGLIDRVRHSCKFKDFGCTVKDFLKSLTTHESFCDHRTITCPTCEKQVQVKKFNVHALSPCISFISKKGGKTSFPVASRKKDLKWKLCSFEDGGNMFYVTQRYFANSRMFFIHVALADKPSEAQNYQAEISIMGDIQPRRKTTMTTNVDSLENVPQNEKKFLKCANCWMIPIKQLMTILKKTPAEFDSSCEEDQIKILWTFKINRRLDSEGCRKTSDQCSLNDDDESIEILYAN